MHPVTNTLLCFISGIPTLAVVLTTIDLHRQYRKLGRKLDQVAVRIGQDREQQPIVRFPSVEELFKGLNL